MCIFITFRIYLSSEEQIFEIDNKIKELEVMISLFESKLFSLPQEIVDKFPILKNIDIGNFNSDTLTYTVPIEVPSNIVNSLSVVNEEPEIVNNEENIQTEEQKEKSPAERLEEFLNLNPDIESLYKSLKIGISIGAVVQKGKMQAIDGSIVEKLISLYKEVNPNAS